MTAIFLINKNRLFPGWWALFPVCGAVFLILAGPKAIVNRSFLASKIMVFFGLISYPLYLWHWPIFSFARIIVGGEPSLPAQLVAIILSVLLAFLTYKFIEKPVRTGKLNSIKITIFSFLMLSVGVSGFYVFKNDGFELRALDLLKITKAAGEWGFPGDLLEVNDNGNRYLHQASKKPSQTIFIGDSNIEQYYPRAATLVQDDPINTNGLIFKSINSCLPIPAQIYDELHKNCTNLMSDALKIVKERPEIDKVVIGGKWSAYLLGGWGMARAFGVGTPEYEAALISLGAYIRELRALNKRVYLVLNIPTDPRLDPKRMVLRDLKSFPNVLSVRADPVPREALEMRMGQMQRDLEKTARDSGAIVINPMNSLCTPECLALDESGEPIYKDAAHLRPKFVRAHANFIDETVR